MRVSIPFVTVALAITTHVYAVREFAREPAYRRSTRIFGRKENSPVPSLSSEKDPYDDHWGTPKSIPAVYLPNDDIGTTNETKFFQESAHFRVYDSNGIGRNDTATKGLAALEAAHDCFVNDFKWRSPGLSYWPKSDDGYDGPFYKTNVFVPGELEKDGPPGEMDAYRSYAFFDIQPTTIDKPYRVTHEFGHVMTYAEKGWVGNVNTGPFWEPIGDWFSDTYETSDFCAAARKRGNQPTADTSFHLDIGELITNSSKVLVSGIQYVDWHYYSIWPLFTYMTNNPDKIEGLGKNTVRNLFRAYKNGSDETPLHTIAYLTKTPVREIISKWWARMAYFDIDHPIAQTKFEKYKSELIYNSLVSNGTAGSYKPKPQRMPKYFGSNIIPLKTTGKTIGVKITAQKPFIAHLVVKKANVITYTACPDGACTADVGEDSEATLVIVNAPLELIKYDGFNIQGPVTQGLYYQLTLTGATP